MSTKSDSPTYEELEEQANRMAGTLQVCSDVMERWRDALEAIATDARSSNWASLMAHAALNTEPRATAPWTGLGSDKDG
jgi:hypothetical protein